MFALPLLFNCGDAASIDVESLDSPCACTEAMLTVMDELIPIEKDFYSIDKPSDEEKDEYLEDVKPLTDKVAKIKKKCVGDLAAKFAKADKDCEAAKEFNDKLKVLMKYDNSRRF